MPIIRKCNKCWNDCPEGKCYITKCHHVFCLKDARECFSKEMNCPACSLPLNRNDIRYFCADEEPTQEKLSIFCGHDPRYLLKSMELAMGFWIDQSEVNIKYLEYKLETENEEFTMKEKKMKGTIQKLEQQIHILQNRVSQLQSDLDRQAEQSQILHKKYMAKVNEKSKLEELFQQEKIPESSKAPVRSKSANSLFTPAENPIVLSQRSSKFIHSRSSTPVSRDGLFSSNIFQATRTKPTKRPQTPSFLKRKTPSLFGH